MEIKSPEINFNILFNFFKLKSLKRIYFQYINLNLSLKDCDSLIKQQEENKHEENKEQQNLNQNNSSSYLLENITLLNCNLSEGDNKEIEAILQHLKQEYSNIDHSNFNYKVLKQKSKKKLKK